MISNEENENNVSLLTKNASVFNKIQVEIKELTARVEHRNT